MKPRSSLKVFVYGTLKPGEANYLRYCSSKVEFQQKAYTKGMLYDLPFGYPAMTEGENNVKGVLLTVKDLNILDNLDRLEGYQPQRTTNLNEYFRRLVPVYNLSDRFIDKAWAYFMTPAKIERYGGILVRSNWWTGVGKTRKHSR